MANLNRVLLIGNLTRDPEVKYTPNGTAVADFGIAVNRTWKNDRGEKQEEVTFVDVQCWAKLAEVVGEYLRKGAPVFIEGRLKLDTWDDKQTGQKRSKLRVIGEHLQMLGTKRPESSSPGTTPSAPQRPRDPDLDAEPEDIPF
jgi:single-strand DNA-binding protein